MKPRNALRLKCPHCAAAARIRSSQAISTLTRQGYIECTDIAQCGWRGKYDFTFSSTLVQSVSPNPDIHLPVKTPEQHHA